MSSSSSTSKKDKVNSTDSDSNPTTSHDSSRRASSSLLRMPEWSWSNNSSNSNSTGNTNLNPSSANKEGGVKSKSASGTSPNSKPVPLPHSKFIPEAERGWKRPVVVGNNGEKLEENPGKILVGKSGGKSNSSNQQDEKARRSSLPSNRILETQRESFLNPNEELHSGRPIRTSSPNPIASSNFGDPPRGFAHDSSMSKAYVNPLHRNPTAKQAFYDTHFGDSSLTLATKKMKKKVIGLGMLKSLSSSGKEKKMEIGSKGNGTSEEKRDETVAVAGDSLVEEGEVSEEDEEEEENEMVPQPSSSPIPPDLPSNLSARMLRQTASINSELDEATSPAELELVASIEEEDYAVGTEDFTSPDQDQNQDQNQNQNQNQNQKQSSSTSRTPHSNLWSTISGRIGTVRNSIAHGLPSLDGLATSFKNSASTQTTAPISTSNQKQDAPPKVDKENDEPGSLPIGLGWEKFPQKASTSPSSLPPTVAHTWAGISEVDWTIPEVAPTIHRDVKASEVYKHLKGNVVILGGYRGSVLRDSKTKEMMWIPIKVGVKLRNPKLELGLDEESQTNSEALCYSSGGVTNIGKLVDMGKRLHERCNSRKGCSTFDFGYDWRLSLRSQSPKLISFLSELKEATKEGAHVIAHSMGGLLVLHALSQAVDPTIFRSIVFASSPFNGTPNMLGPLMWGDAALKNDTICSPRATFSFRSSFYLLPRDGRCFELEIKRKKQGGKEGEKEISTLHKDSDFLDIETWLDYGLSPCLNRAWKAAQDQDQGEGYLSAESEKKEVVKSKETPSTSINASSSSPSKAENDSQSPFPDLSMATSPEVSTTTTSNNVKTPEDVTDQVADKAAEAVSNVASVAANEVESDLTKPQELEDGKLMEENQEKPKDERKTSTSSKTNAEEVEEVEGENQAQREAWDYLERTLNDVKAFDQEIVKGFDQVKLEKGLYPPISILTSGRTPTVRGALVSKHGWDQEEIEKEDEGGDSEESYGGDGYKKDIREGNYSRMLYSCGDGVILRRSAIALPGRWSELLVKDPEIVQLETEKAKVVHHLDSNPSSKRKHIDTPLPLTERLKLEISDGVVETAHRHVTLLSDLCGVGICLEANRRAEACRRKNKDQK